MSNTEKNLPTRDLFLQTSLEPTDAADLPDDEQDCFICTVPYRDSREVFPAQREQAVRLPCGHVVGEHCIRQWIDPKRGSRKNTCPLDRQELFKLERVKKDLFPGLTRAGRLRREVGEASYGRFDDDDVYHFGQMTDFDFVMAPGNANVVTNIISHALQHPAVQSLPPDASYVATSRLTLVLPWSPWSGRTLAPAWSHPTPDQVAVGGMVLGIEELVRGVHGGHYEALFDVLVGAAMGRMREEVCLLLTTGVGLSLTYPGQTTVG